MSSSVNNESNNNYGNNGYDISNNNINNNENNRDIFSNNTGGNSSNSGDGNSSIDDIYNGNVIDISLNVPNIINFAVDQTLNEPGLQIVNQQGTTIDNNYVINTRFNTTDPSLCDIDIRVDLLEVTQKYDDELDPNSQTSILFQKIKTYAGEIKCEKFHGKGTIDDYTELFKAASKIANESKQIQLDIDVEGFTEFGNAADELSNLFTSFIFKLQNVNIINDIVFLTAISNALEKIVNLSKIFGHFKETIISTTTIQIPKSTHDTAVLLNDVIDEINCAIQYINYYVDSSLQAPPDAMLTQTEQNIISKAVTTIDNWNTICDEGVTIAMSNNPDVQYIKKASGILIQSTSTLKNATSKLKTKLYVQSS